ncbi:MAG: hypothetical protein HY544_03420 [Candidatus Diapherotrites archaeon]|uniref:Uncharacterized protein n=1 Tax=Candidatus Iainarchaeum sp. TaxID=3101447 RepID=A0A8T3YNE9_9ARCH|nr:hypothetical protein [Candidatus Diapherotrites archaeon]
MARLKTRNTGEFGAELDYRAKRIANLKVAKKNLEDGVGLIRLIGGTRLPFPEVIGTTPRERRHFDYKRLQRISGADSFRKLPELQRALINQKKIVLEEMQSIEQLLKRNRYTPEEIEEILGKQSIEKARGLLKNDSSGELHTAVLKLGDARDYLKRVEQMIRRKRKEGR